MNKVLQKATSSPEAALQFIVDTQYDVLLSRAIGSKVVNSDVGRENLFNSLTQIAGSGQVELFNYILGGDISYDGLTPEAQEALEWANRKAATPNGQLWLQRSETLGNGGNGGWTSQNTDSAFSAFGALIAGLSGLWSGNDAPPPPTGGSGGSQPPAPGTGFASYMPWVLGIVGVLIVAIVVVVALRKK